MGRALWVCPHLGRTLSAPSQEFLNLAHEGRWSFWPPCRHGLCSSEPFSRGWDLPTSWPCSRGWTSLSLSFLLFEMGSLPPGVAMQTFTCPSAGKKVNAPTCNPQKPDACGLFRNFKLHPRKRPAQGTSAHRSSCERLGEAVEGRAMPLSVSPRPCDNQILIFPTPLFTNLPGGRTDGLSVNTHS